MKTLALEFAGKLKFPTKTAFVMPGPKAMQFFSRAQFIWRTTGFRSICHDISFHWGNMVPWYHGFTCQSRLIFHPTEICSHYCQKQNDVNYFVQRINTDSVMDLNKVSH